MMLFSFSFTRRQFPSRHKELLLLYTLLLLSTILETCTLIPSVHHNLTLTTSLNLINLISTLGFILLNVAVCLVLFYKNARAEYDKYDVTLTERVMFKRQCAAMCYVLVTLAFLPKVTYDTYGWVNAAGAEYFELSTFLLTRALLYTSAFVQIFCGAKLL